MKTAYDVRQLGIRGGGQASWMLWGYNARAIVATFLKLDAGTTGFVQAINNELQPYNYADSMMRCDLPTVYYEFIKTDIGNGTVAHDNVGNRAVTVTNNGITAATAGASRYTGAYGMLLLTATVTDNSSPLPLSVSENNTQPWSMSFWIFRFNNTLASTIYFETNGGSTIFQQLLLNTNGTLSFNRVGAGGTSWTSPVGSPIPLNQWSHIVVVYSTANTMQGFLNGVSMGTASAATRGTAIATTQASLNTNANSQFYLTQLALFRNVLFTADDANRHFLNLTADRFSSFFNSTASNIAQGGKAVVVFTNDQTPQFIAASNTLINPLTPNQYINVGSGIFSVGVTWYWEN